jgi:PAS domain S-box-containing protein
MGKVPDSPLFRDVFTASPIGIAVGNLDGQLLFVNPAFCSMLGFSEEEMRSKNCVDFSPREDAEKDWALFQQLRAGSLDHYKLEKRYFRRDGLLIWGRLSVSLLKSTPPLIVAMVEEITENKTAEEARFRHAAIVDSSEDAIISKNLDAVIVSWNAGAQRIFGYTEEEAVGQPITLLIPPELLDEENTILERLRAGGRIEHYETVRVTKAGKKVDVSLSISSVKDSTGSIVGFTKIAHDITKRKQVEDAVKESEQRFRLIADTAPVMIWMSDTDKLCIYFNKPWLDFTGRSLEEELGNGWAEGVHADDLQNCLDTYTQFFRRREKFRMQYRLRRYDGEYRWILDIGVPRLNQDRSFAGYIGIAVDVTERKEAEEALRELNRALEKQTAELQAREELLKIFVKNVPAGVAMLDRDMRYLQLSERWCADYSVSDSFEVLGRSHYELFPDIPDRWKEVHRRALAGETLRADEDRWDREDGTTWVR